MERDVGGGYYDARIGNLYIEVKRPEDGLESGIEDSFEYIEEEVDDIDFFTTEGIHAAHVTRGGVVERGDVTALASRLQTLLEDAITSPTPEDIVDAFGPIITLPSLPEPRSKSSKPE